MLEVVHRQTLFRTDCWDLPEAHREWRIASRLRIDQKDLPSLVVLVRNTKASNRDVQGIPGLYDKHTLKDDGKPHVGGPSLCCFAGRRDGGSILAFVLRELGKDPVRKGKTLSRKQDRRKR